MLGRRGVPVDRRLPLLLLRCRDRGDTAASRPKLTADSSCAGESMAEDGAVADRPNLGVCGSEHWVWVKSRSNFPSVWPRGRWKLEPADEAVAWSKMPESAFGEKVNCDAGLKVPTEKLELGGSVMALDKEVVLCECGWLYALSKSANVGGVSLSSLCFRLAGAGRGDALSAGEAGEATFVPLALVAALGTSQVDEAGDSAARRVLSGMAGSEALRMREPGPMLWRFLNFSSQEAVMILEGFSELPVVAAKKVLALVSISSSLMTRPFFCWFFSQLNRVRSKSTFLPLSFLTGELLRSSWRSHLSRLLRTLDTVLGRG